jgi:CHASE2 domain-containing sensor protein
MIPPFAESQLEPQVACALWLGATAVAVWQARRLPEKRRRFLIIAAIEFLLALVSVSMAIWPHWLD